MDSFLHFSVATSLGLHAMAFISSQPGRLISAREIAAALDGSEAHLHKILQLLVKAKILKSARGPKGGEPPLSRPTPVAFCDSEDIRRVVEGRRHGISWCFEQALLVEPELGGKVTLVWRIDPEGRPRAVQVESTTLGARAAELCMVEAVRRWHFPRPESGQCQIRYPFVFSAR